MHDWTTWAPIPHDDAMPAEPAERDRVAFTPTEGVTLTGVIRDIIRTPCGTLYLIIQDGDALRLPYGVTRRALTHLAPEF